MATEYQESPALEMARKRLAEEKEISDHTRADAFQQLKGKPTPTQEENDLSACGAHVLMHEHDGSMGPLVAKHMEPEAPAGTYQTRQARAASRPAPPPPPAQHAAPKVE
jgi:hypothetical protein